MKKALLILLWFTASVSVAQVHSVQLFSEYSVATAHRLGVTKASAVGGGIELRLQGLEHFTISVLGGYNLYSIQQENALVRWNWRFWNERYQGIVKDNLVSDTSLSAALNPVQKMDGYPLQLRIGSEFTLGERIAIAPYIGGGLYFYTRRLYLMEDWEKRFSAVNYTFEYSYRNFATQKNGRPLLYHAGTVVSYEVSEIVRLSGAVHYQGIIATPGKMNYDEFPLRGMMNFQLGIGFLY